MEMADSNESTTHVSYVVSFINLENHFYLPTPADSDEFTKIGIIAL